ncbi:hypothetical protein CBR_g19289 [Chara braunii]|uniref:Myb-like domain-containing protein n=1 Tax=Chara braunii TaxID=69332 RepID=A0A388KXK0_CHABU|nr:hypothetical protein CBR_g19289 [Chara braunii]|eukprot:GBG74777.1 hypothetical protein CBR_g19289 [Chara braunii]
MILAAGSSFCTVALLNAEEEEQPSMAHYSQHAGLSSIEDWGYSETQNEGPPAARYGSSSLAAGEQQQCYTHDGCKSQCPIGDKVGANVGGPEGDLQQAHRRSVFLFGGPAWSGGGVRGPENAHVTAPVIDVPLPSVVTGHGQLPSPVSPVAGFRMGLGGDDEVALRQRLRLRAMAMSDGLSLSPDERGRAPVALRTPPRTDGSCHGSPGPSTVSSVDNDTTGCRSSHTPAALSPNRQASFRLSPESIRGDASPQPHVPHTGSPEYVINRIIRENEAGGLSNQDCDPRRLQNTPCSVENVAGTSTTRPSEAPPTRPPPAEKNTDRWGETETEWLCRFRNEVKTLMGEETEPLGRARLKTGFWKDVEQRMKGKGFNRNAEQCKNKFNTLLDYYRRLKAHKSWSGLPSYWDMNQTRRKKYNVDFVLRRAVYDIIHPVEKDKDSINLSNLMDSGADEERLEDSERCNNVDAETEGGSEDPAVGSGSSPGLGGSSGGQRSTGFGPVLGKRRRSYVNARESSMHAVTGAMRDHTAALTRSDRECVKMRCEATRDIARHQAEVNRELMQQEIASRERIATITGERVEKGYLILADAIRSLRRRSNSPSSGPDSSDSR